MLGAEDIACAMFRRLLLWALRLPSPQPLWPAACRHHPPLLSAVSSRFRRLSSPCFGTFAQRGCVDAGWYLYVTLQITELQGVAITLDEAEVSLSSAGTGLAIQAFRYDSSVLPVYLVGATGTTLPAHGSIGLAHQVPFAVPGPEPAVGPIRAIGAIKGHDSTGVVSTSFDVTTPDVRKDMASCP